MWHSASNGCATFASCWICIISCDTFHTVAHHFMVHNGVESGSDDPDKSGSLRSLLGESSGPHPQTKLSGCDPDITCSLENSVGI